MTRLRLLLLWWVACAGVWPLASPPHSLIDPMGLVDLVLHAVGVVVLAGYYWRRFWAWCDAA